jgi:competence protein ComEC
VEATALELDALPGAFCTRDVCLATLHRGGRAWHLLATRSPYQLDLNQFREVCRWADIAISDRRLPRTCTPRWLKLDAPQLRETGGVAIDLARTAVRTVNGEDQHPWIARPAAPPS